jgi:uncharacterized protein YceH (UPF0502 family)
VILDPVEVRVLGSLLEKESTTPEYYPLTLNALLNACNQKSNRDPVVSYDDGAVLDAISRLRQKKLALEISGPGMRVPKYAQRLSETLNLGRRESALLCVLMLRGRQTAGELRDRTARMHSFGDIGEVEACLDRLAAMDPPLAVKLPRMPGEKESRYLHLLCGPVETPAPEPPGPAQPAPPRLDQIEAAVTRLAAEVEDLKRQFAEFRKQFE